MAEKAVFAPISMAKSRSSPISPVVTPMVAATCDMEASNWLPASMELFPNATTPAEAAAIPAAPAVSAVFMAPPKVLAAEPSPDFRLSPKL